jgi:hypothetical protein
MVMHCIAYYGSIPAGTGLQFVPNITDGTVTPRGNGYIVPSFAPKIMLVYCFGQSFTRAQLQSPSLRANWPFDVEPVDVATTPSSTPPLLDLTEAPIPLAIGEELDVQNIHSLVASESDYVLVILTDGAQTPYTGYFDTIRATAATTLVAGAWTLCPLTFPTPLPSENYQVVGMRAHSAGGGFARLWFPGYGHRPGCISYSTVAKHDFNYFRYGKLGVFGQFNVASPPQAEFLSTSADNSEVVELDLAPMP